MSKVALGIAMQEYTADFLRDALNDLPNDTLDQLQIDYELESSDGLAGEPILIGALITGSTIAISAFVRLLERKMENNRQEKQLDIVAEGFRESPELGELLADLAKGHSKISISHGIAKEAWESKQ